MVKANSLPAPKIAAKWRRLWKRIPGYDPIATAARGDYFDAAAAEFAIAFFEECLTHTKGRLAGTPLLLEPWEKAILAALWGWKRADGLRRYREAFIYLPRKNGKTTFAAGIMNLAGFTDEEPGAELYSSAADREQASLIFAVVKGQIENEDELDKRSRIYRNAVVYGKDTSYKPLSSEAGTKHGLNCHVVINDELHAHKDRELIDVLETGTGARDQPLIIHITTADYMRESVCNDKYEYAQGVRDGILPDSAFLPVIFEASAEDDWKKVATWKKANPNYGISLTREYMRRECLKAQRIPRYENTFKRLHLNIRTEQSIRWIQMDAWKECPHRFNVDDLLGLPCYGGLDLSSTRDITAFVLYFPDPKVLLPAFWVPAESVEIRSRLDKVPYDVWSRDPATGLRVTKDNSVDYDTIRAHINQEGERFNILNIAADPWQSEHIQQDLAGDGFEITSFRQGFRSMSGPCKEFERLWVNRELNHGGNKVLRWMARNVVIDQDAADNIKPNKSKSKERIDGIVASIMAIGLSLIDDPSERESIYDKREGLLTI